jgi:transcriptional regulator of met regulon
MQNLTETSIDWHERRSMSKLYVDQIVKYDRTKRRRDVCRLEEGLDKVLICHRFYQTYTANTIPTKLLKSLETS